MTLFSLELIFRSVSYEVRANGSSVTMDEKCDNKFGGLPQNWIISTFLSIFLRLPRFPPFSSKSVLVRGFPTFFKQCAHKRIRGVIIPTIVCIKFFNCHFTIKNKIGRGENGPLRLSCNTRLTLVLLSCIF